MQRLTYYLEIEIWLWFLRQEVFRIGPNHPLEILHPLVVPD